MLAESTWADICFCLCAFQPLGHHQAALHLGQHLQPQIQLARLQTHLEWISQALHLVQRLLQGSQCVEARQELSPLEVGQQLVCLGWHSPQHLEPPPGACVPQVHLQLLDLELPSLEVGLPLVCLGWHSPQHLEPPWGAWVPRLHLQLFNLELPSLEVGLQLVCLGWPSSQHLEPPLGAWVPWLHLQFLDLV